MCESKLNVVWSLVAFEHYSYLLLVDFFDWHINSDECSHKWHNKHACEQVDRPLDFHGQLHEEVELGRHHDGHDQAHGESENGCWYHNHEGLVHEDPSSWKLGESHRAQNSVLPNRFVDILSRWDHQQEECDGQSDDSNDCDKDLEDDRERLEAFLDYAGLKQDYSAVLDHTLQPISKFSLLCLRDVWVEPDEALLLRNSISKAICTSLCVKLFSTICKLEPSLIEHLFVSICRNQYWHSSKSFQYK